MASWDEIIDEQLVQPGFSSAAALANAPPDLAFYAAAPVAGGEGWKHVWSEDHVQDIQVSDDQFEKRTICEAQILSNALLTGSAPSGIWLGKTKYKVVQHDPNYEVCDQRVTCLFANRPRGGAHIVATDKTVVIGLYNEECGQTSGNCKLGVIKFVEYLLMNGC